MYTQEILIGVGIACSVGGIILGLVAGRFFLRSKHAATLEGELKEAQAAMADYKQEVFQQFGDTARKFEKLNESYADLHQQLANSASVLCADMPSVPLIAGGTVTALASSEDADADTVTPEQSPSVDGSEVDSAELVESELEEVALEEVAKNNDSHPADKPAQT